MNHTTNALKSVGNIFSFKNQCIKYQLERDNYYSFRQHDKRDAQVFGEQSEQS